MNPTFLIFFAATVVLLVGTIVLAVLSLFGRFDLQSRRLLRAYVLIAIIGITAIPALAYPRLLERINTPIDLSTLTDRRTPDGSILQSTEYTCAPAALANVAKLNGIQSSEREMAILCKTTRHGTVPTKMITAAKAAGMNYRLANDRDLKVKDLTELSILFVDHPATGPESHSVVFLRRNRLDHNQIEIIDPLRGRTIVGIEELNLIFHGSLMEPTTR